ncbi:MAG: Re/Si-specific NAD(P)(+) transhydrogenase subunit alpha [Bdellovibrionota bacterium]
MRFGVAKETQKGETRVALVPEMVKALVKRNHQVLVQSGAGLLASFSDSEYVAAGATLARDAAALFAESETILKVQPFTREELALLGPGKATVSFLWHLRNSELIDELARRKVTAFAMDAIPRITRAQSMDALSSMATIAGYKAVLLAANHLGKFLPMLTTAAGTIRPAQGFILGAGVAGLQAIATARRLGAVVEAFDARAATKEQVQSLGATFVELRETSEDAEGAGGYARQVSEETLAKQQALIAERLKAADFVITTAQVPGKTAPRLITPAMVAQMKPGSVIVDLAAETGGNCTLTKPDERVVENQVLVLGPTNLPAELPLDASRMYSRNIVALITDLTNDKGFTFDWNNPVFSETCLTHNGERNTKRGMK